jgi:hypothetical protein
MKRGRRNCNTFTLCLSVSSIIYFKEGALPLGSAKNVNVLASDMRALIPLAPVRYGG